MGYRQTARPGFCSAAPLTRPQPAVVSRSSAYCPLQGRFTDLAIFTAHCGSPCFLLINLMTTRLTPSEVAGMLVPIKFHSEMSAPT